MLKKISKHVFLWVAVVMMIITSAFSMLVVQGESTTLGNESSSAIQDENTTSGNESLSVVEEENTLQEGETTATKDAVIYPQNVKPLANGTSSANGALQAYFDFNGNLNNRVQGSNVKMVEAPYNGEVTGLSFGYGQSQNQVDKTYLNWSSTIDGRSRGFGLQIRIPDLNNNFNDGAYSLAIRFAYYNQSIPSVGAQAEMKRVLNFSNPQEQQGLYLLRYAYPGGALPQYVLRFHGFGYTNGVLGTNELLPTTADHADESNIIDLVITRGTPKNELGQNYIPFNVYTIFRTADGNVLKKELAGRDQNNYTRLYKDPATNELVLTLFQNNTVGYKAFSHGWIYSAKLWDRELTESEILGAADPLNLTYEYWNGNALDQQEDVTPNSTVMIKSKQESLALLEGNGVPLEEGDVLNGWYNSNSGTTYQYSQDTETATPESFVMDIETVLTADITFKNKWTKLPDLTNWSPDEEWKTTRDLTATSRFGVPYTFVIGKLNPQNGTIDWKTEDNLPDKLEEGDWYFRTSVSGTVDTANIANHEQKYTDLDLSEMNGWDAAEQAVKFTVTAKRPGEGTLTMDNWTEGDNPPEPVFQETIGDNVAPVFTYSGTLSDGTDYPSSPDKPTKAGNYTVTATVADGTNYLGYTVTANFKIEPMVVMMLPVNMVLFTQDKTTVPMNVGVQSHDGISPLPDNLNVRVTATSKNQALLTAAGNSIKGAYSITWNNQVLGPNNPSNVLVANFNFASSGNVNTGNLTKLEQQGTAQVDDAVLEKLDVVTNPGTVFSDVITFTIQK